ncbi:MAG: FAD:protein FMN transferase [Candidatus Peregrinibacteria bacterium]|nr:FAD:protein FMN transferase [Candidatus Peregrinibacteria bacterium]MDZ4244676.1 FAD:protein FMN transferase [Candidatus Gracilibacteria bacterium]
MLICTNANKEMIGSMFQFSIVHEDGFDCDDLLEKLFAEGARIENMYSRFIDNNELADLNSKLNEWAAVSLEFFELLTFANGVFENTNGAFDITVKSVLDGLGYDKDYTFQDGKPGKSGTVELDEKNKKVKISAQIELGGFGKGYAIDRMSEILILNGYENFCIDGGGDIFCKGKDEKGEGWKVHFGHPIHRDEAIGFTVADGFACTSSNPNLRKWGDGKHHLIDPSSGKPAANMIGVYVQSPTAMIADAYATALFAMGYEKAKELLEDKKIPVEAMIISPTGKVFKSENFKGELF